MLRWWPIPFAIGMGAYALAVPEPYPLDSELFGGLLFATAATLLVISAIWPSDHSQLAALTVSMLAALSRAATLILNPGVLDTRRVVAGAVVWAMFAFLLAVVTALTGFVRQRAEAIGRPIGG